MNKRGWIRILEATIAVMLVSGVLLTVYSKQEDRRDSPEEYFANLQKQILADISMNPRFRLNVLNVDPADPDDGNLSVLKLKVDDGVPDAFRTTVRVCNLGDATDYCNMFPADYIATLDYDVFVEETIIASELRDGDVGVFAPKKVRIFIWEER